MKTLFAIGCLLSLSLLSQARTFVLPHILEKEGGIANAQFTFDTTIFATYTGGLVDRKPPLDAAVALYLYDEAGQLLTGGAGTPVCNPCSVALDAGQRKQTIRIDDLIMANGGFGGAAVKLGFGIIVISGSGADAVNLQGFVVNSHTSPFDLSVFGTEPPLLDPARPIGTPGNPPVARTVVIPHILETRGNLSAANSFDTVVYATYSPGRAGIPDGGGAIIDIYLYDDATDQLMIGNNGVPVCAPCTFDVNATLPKLNMTIGTLIESHGGFGSGNVKQGLAKIVISGADPHGVSLQSAIINTHTDASDVSVFGFEPQPLQPVLSPDPINRSPRRTLVIPHVLEVNGRISTTPITFDTTVFATYTRGYPGGGGGSAGGAILDFYLYDEQTGQLMSANNGIPVCAPCTYELGVVGTNGVASRRKQSIRTDELIAGNGGGFDQQVKLGYGVLVVRGDDPAGVNLQGFVVNSHTSPFDTSVFGFEPQELPPSRASSAKAYVIPHVLERSGVASKQQFTFDTTIFATYSPGLPGVSNSGSASLSFYLYDQGTSQPMLSASGQVVCNPCVWAMEPSARKISLRVDDLIMSKGGFAANVKLGFGVLVVGGQDPEGVNVQGFVVNSHTGPFDLSVFGFEPQPIAAEAQRTAPPVTLSPASVDFGNIQVNGGIALRTFVLRNGGSNDQQIGPITIGHPSFSISSSGCSNLPAGGSCQFEVAFDPAIPGRQTAALSVGLGDGVTLNADIAATAVIPIHFASPVLNVNEGALEAVIAVHRGATGIVLNTDLVVGYATISGTAAESDFGAQSGQITFSGAEVQKFIRIPIIDDALPEGNETFSVRLMPPSEGAVLSDPQWIDVIIHDNDSPQATLRVNVIGQGTVGSYPQGIHCGQECAASFPVGTSVTLFYTPMEGHRFVGWAGACSGNRDCDVTITSNTTVTAVFDPNPPAVKRTWVVPHILESKGSIHGSAHTFDTEIYLSTSNPEQWDFGSSVEMRLLYPSGEPVATAAGVEICNPCRFFVGGTNQVWTLRINDFLAYSGGFPSNNVEALAVITTDERGAKIHCSAAIINSHSGPSDLSVLGFTPEEIRSSSSQRKTFVMPHLLESSGRVTKNSFTFDTTIFATYVGGIADIPDNGGATVELFLYDNDGQPLASSIGEEICNPCQFPLNKGLRKQSIRVDDLIVRRGGFAHAREIKLGYGVITVEGDTDAVALQGFIVNSHNGPFELSFWDVPIDEVGNSLETKRTLVFPHLLDKSGDIQQRPDAFDTQLHLTYAGGLGGVADGGGANGALYLYDRSTGQTLRSKSGQDVCNPCSIPLSSARRKQSLSLDDLIVAAGGYENTNLVPVVGRLVLSGDVNNVSVGGVVINAHTGPFDLSVFGFEPQPLAAEARIAGGIPPSPKRTFILPHILERDGVRNSPYTFDTTLFASYFPSDPGSNSTVLVDLYFRDTFGRPVEGATAPVCNPCTIELSLNRPFGSFNMQDLVQTNGGGFRGVAISGQAEIVIRGEQADAVNLFSFVVNSHTSAFDLSVFGFTPEEVRAPAARQFFDFDSSGGTAPEFEGDSLTSLSLKRFGIGLQEPAWALIQTIPVDARAWLDFTPSKSLIVFSPNETNRAVHIPLLGDTEPEFTERVRLLISNVGTGSSSGAASLATIGIVDDDPPPAPQLKINPNPAFFYHVHLGETVRHNVLVGNPGPQAISIQSVSLVSGADVGFGYEGTLSSSLQPGEWRVLPVTYTPINTTGTVSGVIRIVSTSGVTDLPLEGYGVDYIVPDVHIFHPWGGEVWSALQPLKIRFVGTDNDAISSFALSYSTDGGDSFPHVIGNYPGGTREVIWNIPADLDTANARLRIIARDRNGVELWLTSGIFSTALPPVLALQAPDGTAPRIRIHGGTPGIECTIESSDNLLFWNSIGAVALDENGMGLFLIPGGGDISFFRAVCE